MLEILLWAVGLIGAYIIYAIFAGMKMEDAYCAAISDLKYELLTNPDHFSLHTTNLALGSILVTMKL